MMSLRASAVTATGTTGPVRHGLIARALRVAAGGIQVLVGVSGTLGMILLLGHSNAGGAKATPLASAGAAAFALSVAALFAALVPPGARRLAAGIRGHSPARASAGSRPTPSAWRMGDWGPDLLLTLRARRGLALLAAVLAAGAVLLPLAGRNAATLTMFLLGAAAVSALVAALARSSDRECVFCGVRGVALVAAESVAICEGCALEATGVLAASYDERQEASAWCGRLVRSLPRRCPHAVSRPFIEYLAGPARTPAGVRNAMGWCVELENWPLARELLEAIPEKERIPSDWLNLGVALAAEERFDDALQATGRGAADEPQRPWVLNNSAWMEVRRNPQASDAQLSAWLDQVLEAQRLLESRPAEERASTAAYFDTTEAELRLRLRDSAGALGALARAQARGPLTGERLLIRARVLASAGRSQEARDDAERALRLLHPEALESSEARRLLDSLA